MSQLEELEHPLQKHPLNFTNVQNGNTFYSLTETDSLDFLLDAVPSTLLPPSPDAACSFPSQQRPEPTESPVSSNPSLEEPWEETGTATSASLSMVAFTGDQNVKDPLQSDFATTSQWTKDETDDSQQPPFVMDDEVNSKRNDQDIFFHDIQVEMGSHLPSKNVVLVRFLLSAKYFGTESATTREGIDAQLESILESDAKKEETKDNLVVALSIERSKEDFKLLDAMLRKEYRFCIFPRLPEESFTDRFRYKSGDGGGSTCRLQKEYERYLERINRHPQLGHSDEFLSFFGACKDGMRWSERCTAFLRNTQNKNDDTNSRIGKNLAQWARCQVSEATKELRKGLSLIFESHHSKEVDSQESVLARMEKIDRYLHSLETGLVAAHKALEQYVERRCSLSKLVSSLECCFLERSHQEGSKMGTIFCQVAQSFAKDMIYPKSQGEEWLDAVLQDYSFLARDARRVLGERLQAYESYEKALSEHNERMRKLENGHMSSSTSSQHVENPNHGASFTASSKQLNECRQLYERAAYLTDSELRRFRLEYHLEMNRALYRLAYEHWKAHMDSGKSWEQVFRLCDKQRTFLQLQSAQR